MKAFNFDEAQAGRSVCTRDGRPARIICFNRKDETYPIVALVENGSFENTHHYTVDGLYRRSDVSNNDLMMAGKKMSGWINVYNDKYPYTDRIYPSKKEAISNKNELDYVTTVEVNWED